MQEVQIKKLQGAWEALAVHSFSKGRFDHSLSYARKWIDSEEYNLQAYASAAAVANILDMFEEALRFVEKAVRVAGVDDQTRNAFSFAQASLGNLEVAELTVERIPETAGLQYYVARANQGLIAFRRGNIEEGKEHYLAALSGFRKLSNKELEASALLYFSYELRLAGQVVEAQRRFQEFNELKKKVKLGNVDSLGERMAVKMEGVSRRDA